MFKLTNLGLLCRQVAGGGRETRRSAIRSAAALSGVAKHEARVASPVALGLRYAVTLTVPVGGAVRSGTVRLHRS